MKNWPSEWNAQRWNGAVGWRGYFVENGQLLLEDRVKAVLEFLDKKPGCAYLDIGCLDGTLTSLYAEKIGAATVYGADVYSDVRALEKGIDVKVLDISISSLPFGDESFDRITMCDTIEHLLDPEAALLEIYRILKPDGRAVLSLPRIDSKLVMASLLLGFQPPGLECSVRTRYDSPPGGGADLSGHVSHFTKKAFLEMLSATGFVLERFEERSISSSWKLARKAKGGKVGLFWQLAFIIYDLIPFRQDVMIATIKRK